MSLIEKANAKAIEASATAQEKQALADLEHAKATAKKLHLGTGFEVTFQPPVQIACSGYSRRDSWRGGYDYPPELTSSRLYLIEDVRLATNVKLMNATREFVLVRPCSTCNRLAAAELHLTTDWSWEERQSREKVPDEKKQERFISVLAGVVAKAPVCTFCMAQDEGSRCPTCNRAYDR